MSTLSEDIYNLACLNPELKSELAPLYKQAKEEESASTGKAGFWQLLWTYSKAGRMLMPSKKKKGKNVLRSTVLDSASRKAEIRSMKRVFGGHSLEEVAKDAKKAEKLLTLIGEAMGNATTEKTKRMFQSWGKKLKSLVEKNRA